MDTVWGWNTKFFHTTTIIHRKRNKIEALIKDDGSLVTDEMDLKGLPVQFFQDLYTTTGDLLPLQTRTSFPRLPISDLEELERPFLDIEIKDAVFAMDPLKALGSDGLQPIFFHSQWDVVGPLVCELIRTIYNDPDQIVDLNENWLC